jgi:NitT/TauT family transport system substrate-binding protein
MTWYQRFAGAVFSDDPEVRAPEDLIGLKVGLPAPSGASYTGWQALLYANEIEPTAIETEIIGFDQLQAVLQGRVDAAVGYAANEPVQARALGEEFTVMDIADYFDFVSNGLVVAEGLIGESPEVPQALVTATLMGIRDTLADPDSAFEIVKDVVPGAGDAAVRDVQRDILEESLRFWETDSLGEIDEEKWRQSRDFLLLSGTIDDSVPIEDMIDSQFVDAADVAR